MIDYETLDPLRDAAVRAAASWVGARPSSGVRIEKRSWYITLLGVDWHAANDCAHITAETMVALWKFTKLTSMAAHIR
ncbi:MAG TPA: hypothetical protein VGI44_07990 [Acidimicrobiales bacterium]